MKKRLEKINLLSDENMEESLKMIKNDELIKLANFVLTLIENDECRQDKKEENENSGEIRLMVDREIKDWAK